MSRLIAESSINGIDNVTIDGIVYYMTSAIDQDTFQAISVLINDYPAYDLADHLADVMPETTNGQSIWDLPADQLAHLAEQHYPGGALGLQLALMGEE